MMALVDGRLLDGGLQYEFEGKLDRGLSTPKAENVSSSRGTCQENDRL